MYSIIGWYSFYSLLLDDLYIEINMSSKILNKNHVITLDENDSFFVWEEDNVICYVYKNPIVDLETAKINVAMKYKISNNIPRLWYADMINVRSITKSARDYYASNDSEDLVIGAAVLASSAISKIIATFFLNFNKPKTPLKIFTSKEKAFEWLKNLQKVNQN